jgi:hypothetical protein
MQIGTILFYVGYLGNILVAKNEKCETVYIKTSEEYALRVKAESYGMTCGVENQDVPYEREKGWKIGGIEVKGDADPMEIQKMESLAREIDTLGGYWYVLANAIFNMNDPEKRVLTIGGLDLEFTFGGSTWFNIQHVFAEFYKDGCYSVYDSTGSRRGYYDEITSEWVSKTQHTIDCKTYEECHPALIKESRDVE